MAATSTSVRRKAIDDATVAARRLAIQRREQRAKRVETAYDTLTARIRDWLQQHAGPDGRVPPEALGGFDVFIAAVLQELQQDWSQALGEGLTEAAAGAADIFASTGTDRIIQRTLQQLRDFIGADGLQLSDRIWRVNQGTRTAVVDAIRGAILRGDSAWQAAQALIGEGQAVPAETALQIKGAHAAGLGTYAGNLLRDGGSPMRNALRVLRTEINRAFTESFVASTHEVHDIAAVKFNLSPLHPRPDICCEAGTLIATQQGQVPIESVREGDLVLTHRGRFRPVVKLYRSWATGAMIRLDCRAANSRSLPLLLTPNHRVLTHRGWIAAGDLRTEDRLACAPAWLASPANAPGCCEPDTASSDSPQNAPAGAGQTAGARQCGAARHRLTRIAGSAAATVQAPRHARTTDAGKGRCRGFLRPILGCPLPAADRTFAAAVLPAFATSPDAASRNWGYPSRSLEHKPGSNTWRRRCSSLQQTLCRRLGRSAAWWRAFSGSSACRRSGVSACGHATAAPPMQHRSTSMTPGPDALVSYIEYSMQRQATEGEHVYNIGVADDHSYVAAGIVVHNCDYYASANLHGLGAGVYPQGNHPYPAHPETLSFLTVVFVDEISDADRAGREGPFDWLSRHSRDAQAAVLGKNKAAAFRNGDLREDELLAPWSSVKSRLDTTP